jgi:esterase/lipase
MKILIISGFLQNPHLLANILSYSSEILYYHQSNIADLQKKLLGQKFDCVIGWSLGGQIALSLTSYLEIKKLILIATPYNFVNHHNYNLGVTNENFNNFNNLLSNNFNKLLNNFNNLIAYGDSKKKEVILKLKEANLLNQELTDIKITNLLYWLNFLKDFTPSKFTNKITSKTILIYGKKDRLVNYAQASLLQKYFIQAKLELFCEASHAPFLHDIKKFNRLIFD